MTNSFKRSTALRSTTLAGLTLCALFGATLAGCNSGSTASAPGGGETLATVGDAKITRGDLTTFLEGLQGEAQLPYLIDTQLILQSLKAKGQDVTDAEVEADLQRRAATDPQVKKLIDDGGPRLVTIKGQVKRDLAMQKLLTVDVKATDAQVKTFFDKNKKYYDTTTKVKIGILLTSTKARADVMARELTKKTKTFEALVEEQKKANDQAAQGSVAARETFDAPDNFGPAAVAALAKVGKGATTAPVPFGPPGTPAFFAIFKKVDVQEGKKADLATLRPQVETDYKLAEVAKKTAAENPTNPPFEQTLTQTASYLQQQNPTGTAPQLRDVLSFINQTAANNLMTSMRASGAVQIDDSTYAKVGEAYKPAAAATTTGTPAAGAPAGAPAAGAPASNNASAPPAP